MKKKYSGDTPIIPLSFTPPANEYETEHLSFKKSGKFFVVTWPLLGVKILTSKKKYPDHGDVTKHTRSMSFYGHFGYSIGQFHEFFVDMLPAHYSMKLGKAEASIGDVTPLGAYLFDNFHDEDLHGYEWEGVSSVRILGVSPELAEAYLLNAIFKYSDCFNIVPSLLRIERPEYWEDPVRDSVGIRRKVIPTFPPISTDIEPLRCFYNGLQELDHASACIQFYRVLEFYAFFDRQKEIADLRRNASFSDREFLIRAANILTRDEKTPIIRLIMKIIDQVLLETAVKDGLIPQCDAQTIGERIYELRNALVHAKYDQRATITTDSVVSDSTPTQRWRKVLEKLAATAIEFYGQKDLG